MKKLHLFLLIFSIFYAGAAVAAPTAFDKERTAFEARLSSDGALKKALLSRVRPITTQFNYMSLLDNNTDVLLLGEEHNNEQSKRETNLIIKYLGQHKAGFTHFGAEFFLSSEQPFLDQYSDNNISLADLEQKLALGKSYSASAAVAHRYGLTVLGLDVPKAQENAAWAQSIAGMKERNAHWVQIITAVAEKDPMSRFIIYGGAWHTQQRSGVMQTVPQLLNRAGLKTKNVEYVSSAAWAALAAEGNLAGRTLLFTVPNAYRGAATADYYIYLPQNVKTNDAAQEKMGKMMDDKNFKWEHCTDDPDHPLCKVIVEGEHR